MSSQWSRARDATGTWIGFVAPRSHGYRLTQWTETHSVATGLAVVSVSQLPLSSPGPWVSDERITFRPWRTIRSLQSFTTASGNRLRKYTIIDGSNGAEYWNASKPMKNWRYGFSLICSTSSFVGEPQASLDDQGTQCHAKGLCWRSESLAELGLVIILQLIPRNELRQLDPAIVTREFAAERQEEVFERELMTMLTSVHVENSGSLWGSNRPVCAHFTVKNC